MNEALKEQAQIEYQRQYNAWLRSEPDKTQVYNRYAKLEKYITKYYDVFGCPLKIVECMGEPCHDHYRCQTCDMYHMRGSMKKEILRNE